MFCLISSFNESFPFISLLLISFFNLFFFCLFVIFTSAQVLDIDLEELPDIFDILDDGDGAITTEELLKSENCRTLPRVFYVFIMFSMFSIVFSMCSKVFSQLTLSDGNISHTRSIPTDLESFSKCLTHATCIL